MKKNTKVAFIIPVYNVNKYLDECLSSISMINVEKVVYIVDDCGSEDPMPIIGKYLKCEEFKFTKNEKNLGAGFSRNVALKMIGEDISHICFVDPDDYIDSAIMEKVISGVKPNQTYLIGKYIELTKNGSQVKNAGDGSLNKTPWCIWGSLWDANFAANLLFTSRSFEDTTWIISYMKMIDKGNLRYIDDIFYTYRRRKSSLMNSKYDTETIVANINLHINKFTCGLFSYTYLQLEHVYFMYLSLPKKEKRKLNIQTLEISFFKKVWMTFAYYAQKVFFINKISSRDEKTKEKFYFD